MTPFLAASLKHVLPIGGLHSHAKPMGFLTVAVIRLIRSLHLELRLFGTSQYTSKILVSYQSREVAGEEVVLQIDPVTGLPIAEIRACQGVRNDRCAEV